MKRAKKLIKYQIDWLKKKPSSCDIVVKTLNGQNKKNIKTNKVKCQVTHKANI